MKKYEEIEGTPSMASEPVAVYGVQHREKIEISIPQMTYKELEECIPIDVAFDTLRNEVIRSYENNNVD